MNSITKDNPTPADVHVSTTSGKGKAKPFKALMADSKKREDDAAVLRTYCKIAKVDEGLGLVFGWSIVCKVNGEDYYDLNIDLAGPNAGERVPEHIPEDAMLEAASDFMMKADRPGNEMHGGPDCGSYVFAFPLTTDIAKAMNIQTEKTGLMIAYRPPPDVLQKFKSGFYTGFSIEGRRLAVEEHSA